MSSSHPNDWNSGWYFAANADALAENRECRVQVQGADLTIAVDGDTYRVYDGRMSTEWQHYSPGRLIEAAALSRAMTDPRFAVLDWMSGQAAEKLLATNLAEGRARLVATSGSRALAPSASERRRQDSRISRCSWRRAA